MSSPWSIRVQDQAPLTIMIMTRGQGWLIPDSGAPLRFGTGDVAVARGPDPYTVADDPTTPPQVVIHPGERSATLDGQALCDVMDLGVRTWGNDPTGDCEFLVGTYQMRGEVSGRLLRALPPMLVLSADTWSCPLLPLLHEEINKDEPGQAVILDRLLDLVLLATLRAWFSRPEAEAPAWYRAYGDAVVGTALRLLHTTPAAPWTVAELATRVGVSRAALARRFTALVGEPPMAYLTSWRLALAADLLHDPDLTLGAVARQVGYGSPFALSAAFKRRYGVSPQEYRRRALSPDHPLGEAS